MLCHENHLSADARSFCAQNKSKLKFNLVMNISLKPNDQQKANKTEHHDAWTGWGAIIGIVGGVVIGLFLNRALLLGTGLGVMGWLIGALVDRARR
jgi:hypothetical protein